jgi:BlaI family transcriptional regulator, penicillinase repressor
LFTTVNNDFKEMAMPLSDAEWLVMNFIWEHQPVESSAVADALAEANDWSEATVRTMLHRLLKKKALKTEPVGNKFRYRAAVSRHQCVRQAGRSFIQRVFSGACAPALLHFVDDCRLTPDEIRQLRKLLDAKLAQSKGDKT